MEHLKRLQALAKKKGEALKRSISRWRTFFPTYAVNGP
jgi:hypothetical protein